MKNKKFTYLKKRSTAIKNKLGMMKATNQKYVKHLQREKNYYYNFASRKSK